VKRKKELKSTSVPDGGKKPNLVKEHSVTGGEETWQSLGISPVIIQGLHDCGFAKPTPVQALAIPATLKKTGDLVGAAETVSTCSHLGHALECCLRERSLLHDD